MTGAMMTKILMSIIATTMIFQLALAVDHNVGKPNGGWDQSTDLKSWASAQTFIVGDNLVFTYTSLHDVLEVTKDNYDSCTTSNPISTNGASPTTIALTDSGNRYFICGTAGHCDQGMKVEIQTVPAATPPPTSTSPPPSSDSPAPATPPVSTDAPPPNEDNAPPTFDENAPAPPVTSGGSPNNTGETTNPLPTPEPSSAATFKILTFVSMVGFGFLTMV
ncbi:cupredoxin superfamily protein [Artemisia annua]|uniref:Cupredoxin superfamily protein n=1 Tax=Artemisia annua TaxID=35608 RepID=A0A2U1P2Q6_ARTAN|nr:cupredoxin superfamily protein [Artemisia annua]